MYLLYVAVAAVVVSEVAELVLMLSYELDLLRRHLVLGIFVHNAVANATFLTRGLRLACLLIWADQEPSLLILLLLRNGWLVVSVDLAVVECIKIHVSKEGMLLELLGVAIGTKARFLIPIEQLNKKR